MDVRLRVDGSSERVAAGQDVSAVRRYQEDQGRDGSGAARGSVRPRPVPGGCSLGRAVEHAGRGAAQRTHSADAGHLHQSDPDRPSGYAQRLRVSGLQDEAAWTDVRLDVQPQDEGEGGHVGAGWRRPAAAGLVDLRDWHRGHHMSVRYFKCS